MQCKLLRCGIEVEVSNPDGAGCAASLQGCCHKRVARLVYLTCREHGMLSEVLRPSGGLIAIIEEAVSFRVNTTDSVASKEPSMRQSNKLAANCI